MTSGSAGHPDNVGSPYATPDLATRITAKAYRQIGALRDTWLPHASKDLLGHRIRTRLGGRPAHVLVLCQGNICRSPVAAMLLYDALAGSGAVVASAGFGPTGRVSPPAAIATATAVGVDLSTHRSLNIGELDDSAWDLIIGMETSHVWRARAVLGRRAHGAVSCMLGQFAPPDASGIVIPDPEGHSRDVFKTCYHRIAASVAGLTPWMLDGVSQ